jgi:hypothetical protein
VSELFGGKAGDAVPEVNADDVKAVRQMYRELQGRHPDVKAIGLELLKNGCKAGANVEPVCYRHAQLELVKMLAEHNVIPQINGPAHSGW